eukprot:4892384-Lingulodinium_polyedra.AAC.1
MPPARQTAKAPSGNWQARSRAQSMVARFGSAQPGSTYDYVPTTQHGQPVLYHGKGAGKGVVPRWEDD